jgi:signal transduction histidine kinase
MKSGTTAPDAASLVEASVFFIERGFCGLVWLDKELVVADRAGALVDFVDIGKPVGRAILPLHGCEADAHALRAGTRNRLEISNVRIMTHDEDGIRLNFYVHWLATSGRFLVIVMRTTTQTELEAELERESRRRQLAEARSVEQAKELAKINAELQEFASIISHDLKSPMRAMRYYAEDIEQALVQDDRHSAAGLLEDLKQQARRMSRMLSDLLTYARIGHTAEAKTEVDTRALVDAIVASLPKPQGFVVEIRGSWPVIETIEPSLDLVMRNLLDNAIKHHDRSDGAVVVEARTLRASIEISISDDGPGIPKRHHKAIFQPFLKLDQETSAPEPPVAATSGSGIGLSLVRKTAETAGATLTLDSDPDLRRGTTFRLRWPGRIMV